MWQAEANPEQAAANAKPAKPEGLPNGADIPADVQPLSLAHYQREVGHIKTQMKAALIRGLKGPYTVGPDHHLTVSMHAGLQVCVHCPPALRDLVVVRVH
jgi:hypothetical protein